MLTLDPNYTFTRQDVINYAGRCGIVAALNWLLLIPPDRFDGNLQTMYDELERYWKNTNGGGKMASESQKRAVRKYDAANTTQLHLKLNNNSDSDILAWLAQRTNVQGYIKQLIRDDMRTTKNHADGS